MIIVLISMPFIPGQGTGLVAGIGMVVVYSLCYFAMRYRTRGGSSRSEVPNIDYRTGMLTEFSEELTDQVNDEEK
ncbi:hypothetical protein AA0X95_17395 [Bacillus sp. 1P10SD]|uniref:hypothetical protein n=1 Tax=Bacillus sp. 1P10SD TaxID=3132265 RepID=UPI0039A51F4F